MNLTFFYTYATLAHGILGASYMKKIDKKHREKILYFLGHIFITMAMAVRIDERNRGGLKASLLGSVGHSFLLLFFVITTLIVDKKYRISFSGELYYLNILCILGQIGMIIVYWNEYFEEEEDVEKEDVEKEDVEHDEKLKNKRFLERVQNIVFSILIFFYLRMAFKSDNKFSGIFVGLLMISGIYMMALYINLKKYIKPII